MTNWEPGDTALCVNAKPAVSTHDCRLKEGREYMVIGVHYHPPDLTVTPFGKGCGETLELLGVPNPGDRFENAYDVRRFVKQRPLITKDEVEEECVAC